ncbi:hypothetical protein IFM89_030064 [Coptis chinensis]|uniref:OTU domain-containing protein n=1 Tax=Coptis chinensis TaxID=261450 RepID=A0A835IR48_9MAGN|nr:hypothetical protein IFM89_030064 [Coptis chinensis]
MRIEEDLLVSQDVSNDELHDQSSGMEYPNFSDSFVTDVVFPSRKKMVNWVQQVGRGLGMITVTGRSDLNTSGRTPRFFLECQRSEDFENMSGDGNCGFRAVAVGMGFDKETGWIQVRQDLVEEIDTWRHDLYDKMWHDDGA